MMTQSSMVVTTPAKRAGGVKRKRYETATTSPARAVKAIKQEMQDCDICAETKAAYRNFPAIPTCDHEPTVCSDCYKTHFVTKINEDRALGWHACNCPLCAEPVSQNHAQGVLPRTLSKELDGLIQKVKTMKINM